MIDEAEKSCARPDRSDRGDISEISKLDAGLVTLGRDIDSIYFHS